MHTLKSLIVAVILVLASWAPFLQTEAQHAKSNKVCNEVLSRWPTSPKEKLEMAYCKQMIANNDTNNPEEVTTISPSLLTEDMLSMLVLRDLLKHFSISRVTFCNSNTPSKQFGYLCLN